MSSENKLFVSRFSWANGDNVLSPSTNTPSKPKASYLYKRTRGESTKYIPSSNHIYHEYPNISNKSKENTKLLTPTKPDETTSKVLRSKLKLIRPSSHYKHSYFSSVIPDLSKEVSVRKNSCSFLNEASLNKKPRRKSRISSLPTASNPLLSKLLEFRKNFSVKPIDTFRPRVLRIVPKRTDEWIASKGRSMSPIPASTHAPCSPALFLSTVESNTSFTTSKNDSRSELLTIKACPTIVRYRSMSVPRRSFTKSVSGNSMETQTEQYEISEREHDVTMNFSISEGESAEEESPGIRYTAKYSQFN